MGEKIAAAEYRRRGQKILSRNFQPRGGGEIDLVIRDGDVLVFCEVKTRRFESETSRPMDAVDRKKRQLIRRGAVHWLHLLSRPEVPYRFDVAEVILLAGEIPKVTIVQNAFSMPENPRNR